MYWLLSLLIIVVNLAPAHATDSILDTINDTLSLSFSYDNGESYTTLDASYDLTDSWRIFGEMDTLGYWETGVGYNFILGEVYNEISIKGLGGNNYLSDTINPSIGLFSAGFITNELIWMTNFDIGYAKANRQDENLPIEMDLEKYTVDKMVGIHHDTTEWLGLSYMFNHDSSKIKSHFMNTKTSTGHYTYHELVVTLNIKGWKPSFTLTLDGESVKTEIGLSFDF
ncbi:hypothetical protein [Vibrio rarus]|uniref:hypothetical protein n=1 Tax=Vibrio rarus TaxID=413403 RepID=UPI0021C49B8B|nr:hypothetical protein [Vibrio rarus]